MKNNVHEELVSSILAGTAKPDSFVVPSFTAATKESASAVLVAAIVRTRNVLLPIKDEYYLRYLCPGSKDKRKGSLHYMFLNMQIGRLIADWDSITRVLPGMSSWGEFHLGLIPPTLYKYGGAELQAGPVVERFMSRWKYLTLP